MSDRPDEAEVTTDIESRSRSRSTTHPSSTEGVEAADATRSNEDGASTVRVGSDGGRAGFDRSDLDDVTADSSDAAGATTARFGVRNRLPNPSLSSYFSPRVFVALALALGAGTIAGDLTLPFAGRLIGVIAVAFVVGLVASERRYLEVTLAGVSVGAVSALVGHMFLAVAGSGQAVAAVGAGFGVVGSLLGYYFGRDLRNGLSRDVE